MLFVQRLFENLEIQDFLVTPQIGKRTSTAQKKEQIIALSFLQTACSHILLGITESGAILRMKREQNDLSTTSLISEKTITHMCRYCLCLVKDSTHLREHISKLHIGPVTCKMCRNVMDDVSKLNTHKKQCSFPCEVPGCQIRHMRLQQSLNHKKKYLKSLEWNYNNYYVFCYFGSSNEFCV